MSAHDPAEAPPVAPSTIVDSEFAIFYRDTVKHLVGFLVLHGAGPAEAADIAQDTMCAAYQRWSELEKPRAWAFRVASRALGHRIYRIEAPSTIQKPANLRWHSPVTWAKCGPLACFE